jgi:phosphoadenosine phosphosulfate reductase
MNATDLKKLNERFESATPQDILRWAIETHGAKAALTSSFGGQSAALIHMAVQIKPDLPILFINTGFLFKETIAFKDALQKQFKLNIREFRATSAQIEQTRKNLAARTKPSEPCCDDSKVDLMKRSLEGVSCWIAGLRRSQGEGRSGIGIIENYDAGLIKVQPLANWSGKQQYAYMQEHHLPFHPLWEKGYTSIGCEPCTSLPIAGQGERSGRWSGSDKTECGIHTFLQKKD